MLGVGLALAVVEAGDEVGTVYVAFDEVDQDFLTDTRNRHAAPVGASDRGQAVHDAHPGAGLEVGGGAGVACGMGMA